MSGSKKLCRLFSVMSVSLLFCAHTAQVGARAQQPAKAAIPDVEVLDQDGKKVRFYSDLIKGRTVAINFIFTSCTYICPMQGTAFANLQAALGERLGKEVFLVSVSIDPATDTPERLKAWAKQYGARPGWTLVTGEKAEMDKLLLALTGDPARRGEHSPIALIGNDGKGRWIRAYGLDEPARMIDTISEVSTPQR